MALTILHEEVHLWVADLLRDPDEVSRLAATLSANEAARAARFVRAGDRDHYIVARGTLRAILGEVLDLPPEDLRFTYGPQGKPALTSQFDLTLAFNVAHSGDLALYGVARGRRIGVDLEQVRIDLDYAPLARHFFTAAESATLSSLPVGERLRAFYTIWTAKEAYGKAWGEGLASVLKDVVVTVGASRKPQLFSGAEARHDAGGWELRRVEPASGYLGAVVAEGHDWVLVSDDTVLS